MKCRVYSNLYSTATLEKKIEILTPRNCQTVRLQFRGQKTAKAVGRIASEGPQHLARLSGLLVQRDYQYTLVDPEDLHTYTKLQTADVSQTQVVPFDGSWPALTYQLQQMFQDAKETTIRDKMAVQVQDTITIVYLSQSSVEVNWVSSPVNDMISDAVLSMILQINLNPVAFPIEKQPHPKEKQIEYLNKIENHLSAHFGPVNVDINTLTVHINFDGTDAIYSLTTQVQFCQNTNCDYCTQQKMVLWL